METRVYVGTYAKYNNGNIGGAWISLNNCDSYSDFLKKCASIHKDEQDPEFMIQDYENMPDVACCLRQQQKGVLHRRGHRRNKLQDVRLESYDSWSKGPGYLPRYVKQPGVFRLGI